MKKLTLTALSASMVLAISLTQTLPVLAQDAVTTPPAAGNPGQGGNRRGNFNPEEFRKQMAERVKTSLKATDDEWKVLEPLIEKAQTAQRGAGGGGGRGFGGGRGGNNGGGATTPAGTTGGEARPASESQQLRDALQNESTSPAEIKAKLTAVRESRKKSQAELTAAREELRKVVTARQEAVLVSIGVLD
jgi:hypothetical protein